VSHFLERFCHVGREHVLSLIHERCWIIKGRVAVRGVSNACSDCKKRHKLPSTQKMADLPPERVTSGEPPFRMLASLVLGLSTLSAVEVWRKATGCCSRA